jgi:N-carbamoylputrescine amidase
MTTRVSVASVQLDCVPGQTEANLDRARALVLQARARGASLALLPELTPSGYRLTEELWTLAEPWGGRHTAWLQQLAKDTRMYVGMTFLEADGEHFYNAFALAGPSGQLHPRVRKFAPAGPESFFFTGGSDVHHFDTDIGRLGIGICYENFLAATLQSLYEARVDLVLQPFSAPTPIARFPLRKLDVRISDAAMRDQPPMTAQTLGVPVVMANRCGAFVSPMPGWLPGWRSRFPGLSAVVDGDGTVLGQLASKEGVIVGCVSLDASRRAQERPATYGRWAMPVPWWYGVLPLVERRGVRAYDSSASRPRAAMAASQRIAASKA